ncbi:ABC transporter permease subunit [Streptomyces sp. NPDC047042]|uniref:ABC transporter permease n=1 Tax=Streptomyces sp. NPDC047042 TaxID=3154807 RepID=UPI0033C1891F
MRTLNRVLRLLLANWPFIALLVGWDLWVVLNGFTVTVAPRPWAVLATFADTPTTYAAPLLWTALDAVVGLAGGILAGLAAAFLVHLWRSTAGLVTPVALLLRSVPLTALIPIVAAVVGYGNGAATIATVIVCFFPAFAFTLSGLGSVPVPQRDVLSVLGAGRLTRLRLLDLPSALPSVAVALRLSTPIAVGGALLAEMLVGTHGLGRLFVDLRSYNQVEQTWGTALLGTALAVAAFAVSRRVEHAVLARFH